MISINVFVAQDLNTHLYLHVVYFNVGNLEYLVVLWSSLKGTRSLYEVCLETNGKLI